MSIRYPPIRPEQEILPVFSALTDHLHALEEKYDQLTHGPRTTFDRRSLLANLEKLRKKTYVMIGLLQTIQLGIVVISYPIQIAQDVPTNMKNKLEPLLHHLRTLDRRAYRGFFRSTLRKVKNLQEETINLNNEIQHSIDSLRPIRSPRMLVQRTTTTIPIVHSNQLVQSLAPPPLRRSFNR